MINSMLGALCVVLDPNDSLAGRFADSCDKAARDNREVKLLQIEEEEYAKLKARRRIMREES